MTYVAALGTGLCLVGLLAAGGGVGFALAHSPRHRWALLGVAGAMSLVLAVSGAVLGSVLYTRLSHSTSSPITASVDGTGNRWAASDAWLHLVSDPGDWVANGDNRVYTIGETYFSIRGNSHRIEVQIPGDADFWMLDFAAPRNGAFHTGMFTNAMRACCVVGNLPGLDVGGRGHGCNMVAGRFDIKRFSRIAEGDVGAIDVMFEQHCEGMGPALRGELWLTIIAGVHLAAPTASSSVTF